MYHSNSSSAKADDREPLPHFPGLSVLLARFDLIAADRDDRPRLDVALVGVEQVDGKAPWRAARLSESVNADLIGGAEIEVGA